MAAEKSVKNVLKGAAGNVGLGLGSAALDVAVGAYFRTRQGDSMSTAVLKELPSAALWAVAPGPMWAITIAGAIPSVATGIERANNTLRQNYNQRHQAGTNFSYMDTRQAYTMRQAAVQAIQGSKLNARNALGGEASLMHRGLGGKIGGYY